ncbi:MAG: TauD/TfdA family dioxygenase [Alphaproteobacteria bacterium]|nr:TauD/TfdA family dioxygenase [Alphaproteobacteria bacterium]MCY4317986.1 TauD/TfdA family dioxygenase [Alphaproteobacteria bacterium]
MLTFTPANNGFAKIVEGVALHERPDEETREALDAALAEHGVLVFRRQALSEVELVEAASWFGAPETIVRQDWASKYRPEITYISNMRSPDGAPIGGIGQGELAWHTDQSYMANPATGSLLYCVEAPTDQAATSWANLEAAYEALDDAMKAELDGRHAIFSYAVRVAGYGNIDKLAAEDIRRRTPDVVHPLVHAHPMTGRKALYLDPGTMAGIKGMGAGEGRALLDQLVAHATKPCFVYRHDWQVGDAVLWDNGFLLHRRDDFDPAQNRWLKRVTFRPSPDRHIVPGHA